MKTFGVGISIENIGERLEDLNFLFSSKNENFWNLKLLKYLKLEISKKIMVRNPIQAILKCLLKNQTYSTKIYNVCILFPVLRS